MPLGNVIGRPSLKNELISRWENQEANRWAKRTSRVAGVVAEANPSFVLKRRDSCGGSPSKRAHEIGHEFATSEVCPTPHSLSSREWRWVVTPPHVSMFSTPVSLTLSGDDPSDVPEPLSAIGAERLG